MAIKTVDIGAAPLLWSNVKHSFEVINNNFTELANTLNLDLAQFNRDIIPEVDKTYTLGNVNFNWAEVYTNKIFLNELNFGNAKLSIIDGELSFTNNSEQLLPVKFTPAYEDINVNGQPLLSAEFSDTLNIIPGHGIGLITNRDANSLEIINNGVRSVNADYTFNVIFDPLTHGVFIQDIYPNKFDKIRVDDEFTIAANTPDDAFNIDSGYGIILTADSQSNRLTIGFDPEADLYGSLWGADSTLLVDVVNNALYGSVFGTLYGSVVGEDSTPIIDAVSGTIHGTLYGSVFGEDSTPIVDSTTGVITGTLYGSVFADDSTILVDAENGTISWQVIADAPDFVEKTSETGSAILPAGSDADRDAAPQAGYTRFNTTGGVFEGYNGIEWIPFTGGNERVFEFPTAGVHTIDIFSGDDYQSAEYRIQGKAAEGVQVSTFGVLYGGDPVTTFSTEYAQMLSHNTVIAVYNVTANAAGLLTISCETLYPNTYITFTRETLSNPN